ncbi:MAG: S24/S26 family peptidase [Deltaproteobacteria bacterium]|jgi:phage repressor protein C with HTH and peptisase S24 domain|nr:S24/S26 family peptidase [Deltaproteobacteria bacterium]
MIKKGSIVGVIPLSEELEEGSIYLVRRPPFSLVVKRVLMGDDGKIVLRSDNKNYPDQPIPNEGYGNIIVGKVIWVWQMI